MGEAWPGQAPCQVGVIVETKEDIVSNRAENGYEGALQKGTQIEILYVGENNDEAGYLYVEVCATPKHRLWLSFTCIREAGCQCRYRPAIEHLFLPRASSRQPLHASQIPEVWTPGSQPSLTTAPSAFTQWKDRQLIMTLADSTLLLPAEKHVCMHDKDGQPLGDIVGKYGGCFCTGTFVDDIQSIIATVTDNFSRFRTPGEHLRVAYVPAGGCHPKHEFPDHQAAQLEIFGQTEWIATPKLNDLR